MKSDFAFYFSTDSVNERSLLNTYLNYKNVGIYDGMEILARPSSSLFFLEISRRNRFSDFVKTSFIFRICARNSAVVIFLSSPASRILFSREALSMSDMNARKSLPSALSSTPVRSLCCPSSFLSESESFSVLSLLHLDPDSDTDPDADF